MTHYIYAIIGPSGVGKTTLADAVFPKSKQIISFTSRKPRPDEKEAVDYYFIPNKSKAQIEAMKASDDYVELIEYNGNVYGYTTKEVISKFDPKQNSVAAVVTKEGYLHLKDSALGQHVVPVFVYASKEIVKQHMQSRNDSVENIQRRLDLYDQEIKNKEWFDRLPGPKLLIPTESNNLKENIKNFQEKIKDLEND